MNSVDVLYYSLSVGFLVLVGFMCYVLWELNKDLKILRLVLNNVHDISLDASLLKNNLKLSFFKLIQTFLQRGITHNDKK